jgi:hypothetical protein
MTGRGSALGRSRPLGGTFYFGRHSNGSDGGTIVGLGCTVATVLESG